MLRSGHSRQPPRTMEQRQSRCIKHSHNATAGRETVRVRLFSFGSGKPVFSIASTIFLVNVAMRGLSLAACPHKYRVPWGRVSSCLELNRRTPRAPILSGCLFFTVAHRWQHEQWFLLLRLCKPSNSSCTLSRYIRDRRMFQPFLMTYNELNPRR